MSEKAPSLVDFGKLFCAFCVLAIHTGVYPEDRILHFYIFAIVVPFFFVSSGFFLGKKIGKAKEKSEYQTILKKYWKHLFLLYIVWAGWYFCIEIIADLITEGGSLKDRIIQQFLYLLISTPGGGLWYVQVILILIGVLLLSHKKTYRVLLFIASAGLSVVPAAVGTVSNEFAQMVLNAHTFLWDGLYFLVGILLGEMDIGKMNKRTGVIIFASGLMFYFFFDQKDLNLFYRICKMVIAVGVFMILFSSKAPWASETSYKLRRMSTVIYFTHITVKYAIQFGFKVMHLPETVMVFIISALILTIYACIIERYREKKIYKILYSG